MASLAPGIVSPQVTGSVDNIYSVATSLPPATVFTTRSFSHFALNAITGGWVEKKHSYQSTVCEDNTSWTPFLHRNCPLLVMLRHEAFQETQATQSLYFLRLLSKTPVFRRGRRYASNACCLSPPCLLFTMLLFCLFSSSVISLLFCPGDIE